MIFLELQLSDDLEILEALQGVNESTVTTGQFTNDLVLDVFTQESIYLVEQRCPRESLMSASPVLPPCLTLDLLGKTPSRATTVDVNLPALR